LTRSIRLVCSNYLHVYVLFLPRSSGQVIRNVHYNLTHLTLGNLSFVSIVGSSESKWQCTGYDGLNTTINSPKNKTECDQIKQCKSFTAIRNGSDFNSIVASFKLICDDADKPEKIQIIQAAALVKIPFLILILSYILVYWINNWR
jgi:hypothetical protein